VILKKTDLCIDLILILAKSSFAWFKNKTVVF